MKRRGFGGLLAAMVVLFGGCDVHSTVGFDDAKPIGVVCPEDSPLARCDEGPCSAMNVFDAPKALRSTVVDSENIFFWRSETTLERRSLADGATDDLVTDLASPAYMTGDATHIYWTENGGAVRGVPKAGG